MSPATGAPFLEAWGCLAQQHFLLPPRFWASSLTRPRAIWPTLEVSNPTDPRWEEEISAAASWARGFLLCREPGSHGACEPWQLDFCPLQLAGLAALWMVEP